MIQPARPDLPEGTLESLRSQLRSERERLREITDRLREGAARNSPDAVGDTPARTHLADLGSESFEQSADLGLAEQAARRVTEIDGALDRMEQGTYGICESCGRAIPVERLEAIPSASRCAQCQSTAEGSSPGPR